MLMQPSASTTPPPAPPEAACSDITSADKEYAFTVPSDQPLVRRRQLLVSSSGSKSAGSTSTTSSGGGGGTVTRGTKDELTITANAVIDVPADTRPRFLALQRNKIIGGILFHVTRGATNNTCTARFNHLKAPCVRGATSVQYGEDPVFKPGSSLFRADLKDKMGEYYNTSEGSQDIKANSGTPMPFRPRRLPGRDHSQPFLLSENVAEARAHQLYVFLEEGQLFDHLVQEVEASILTFNLHMQTWCLIEIRWLRKFSGYWTTEWNVFTVPITYWSFDSVYSTFWLLLHVLWVLVSILVFLHELRLLRPKVMAARYDREIQHSYTANLLTHFSRLEHVIALVGSMAQMVVLGVFFLQHTWSHTLTIAAERDVYHNTYWEANYFLSSRSGESNGSSSEVETVGPDSDLGHDEAPVTAWALPEENAGMESLADDVATIQQLGVVYRMVFTFQFLCVLTMQMRLFLALERQKRLFVVMQTCRDSIIEVMQCASLTVSTFTFAVLFNIIFGARFEFLSSARNSMEMVAKFAVAGDYKKLRQPYWERSAFDGVVMFLCPFLFYGMCILVFQNFIIAIIVDIKQKLYKETQLENALIEDLKEFYQNYVNVKKTWPSPDKIMVLLDTFIINRETGQQSRSFFSGFSARNLRDLLNPKGQSLRQLLFDQTVPRLSLLTLMSGTFQNDLLPSRAAGKAATVCVAGVRFRTADVIRAMELCHKNKGLFTIHPGTLAGRSGKHWQLLKKFFLKREDHLQRYSIDGASACETSPNTSTPHQPFMPRSTTFITNNMLKHFRRFSLTDQTATLLIRRSASAVTNITDDDADSDDDNDDNNPCYAQFRQRRQRSKNRNTFTQLAEVMQLGQLDAMRDNTKAKKELQPLEELAIQLGRYRKANAKKLDALQAQIRRINGLLLKKTDLRNNKPPTVPLPRSVRYFGRLNGLTLPLCLPSSSTPLSEPAKQQLPEIRKATITSPIEEARSILKHVISKDTYQTTSASAVPGGINKYLNINIDSEPCQMGKEG
ncbi:hypothetical protein CYMTET_31084 [Cymbomonas tetramitiformis]|uniref:Uncharacterized protein n=1 Tax=Cymbomonas tetramitiformis TaxID=36881 RepID=A0AAE0KTH7_9CHLO|nr:hypothetical protein CYMTET_31084 [Cymbomonas tetramitiformis]